MPTSCLDWIHLTEAEFPCIVGLLEWERSTPQPLAIEISLNVDLENAAGGDLRRSVNYATTLAQAEFVAKEGHWELLESLGTALARLLLAPPADGEPRTKVSQAIVRLRKPTVLGGRGLPCVELCRHRSWLTLPQKPAGVPGVAVEVLQEARGTGAYRIQVERGSRWSVPDDMACMLIAGSVVGSGFKRSTGDVVRKYDGTFRASAPACFIGVRRAPAPDSTHRNEGAENPNHTELPNKPLNPTGLMGQFCVSGLGGMTASRPVSSASPCWANVD